MGGRSPEGHYVGRTLISSLPFLAHILNISACSIKDSRGPDGWNSCSCENDLFRRRAQAVHRPAFQKLGEVKGIRELDPHKWYQSEVEVMHDFGHMSKARAF